MSYIPDVVAGIDYGKLRVLAREGYSLYDYAEIAFQAMGGAVATYVVGTNQNAAISGAWPMLEASLPYNAQRLELLATQDCFVMIASAELIAAQAAGTLPAGTPVAIRILRGVSRTILAKCAVLYVIGAGLNTGTLRVTLLG